MSNVSVANKYYFFNAQCFALPNCWLIMFVLNSMSINQQPGHTNKLSEEHNCWVTDSRIAVASQNTLPRMAGIQRLLDPDLRQALSLAPHKK